MEPKIAWRQIRSLRADPPGLATKDDRRKVFVSALEQAEQLFEASSRLGPETSPISMFYGLSQAGRAICAARDEHASNWKLSGHGIKCSGGLDRPIADIEVMSTGKGPASFLRIAETLDSTSVAAPTQLGAILAALAPRLMGTSWSSHPSAIAIESIPQASGRFLTLTPWVYIATHGWPLDVDLGGQDIDKRRAWVTRYIDAHYPEFVGMSPCPDGHAAIYDIGFGRQLTLQLTLHDAEGAEVRRAAHVARLGHEVGGNRYVHPRLPNADSAAHPLILWWAALWTLSMLARYEPNRWASLINVDTSTDSTAIEDLLDAALEVVPELILAALTSDRAEVLGSGRDL